MDFTVTEKGPTLDALMRDVARDLRTANRRAGQVIAKTGRAAMGKDAPRMFGRALTVKAKVDAWPTRCTVAFFPAPRTAGGWAIQESGRRGGYTVKPRRAQALHFAGRFAMVSHPGAVAGRRAWTKAGDRLGKALDRDVADVYDDALGV